MKSFHRMYTFLFFGICNVVLFSMISLFQTHHELTRITERVQEDIVIKEGKWDTTAYNADPLLPGVGSLYVLSNDGYVIERWKPIPGLLDASDFKHLLAFATPQTIHTDTNQEWRVYSLPIDTDGQIRGVVTVSIYHPPKDSLMVLDKEIDVVARTIRNHVVIEKSQLLVRGFDQRTVPHYLSYQVVDTSNTLVFKSNNSNSIDRLPNFIDPSYVAKQLRSIRYQLVKDQHTSELHLITSVPLYSEGEKVGGIIVAGKSVQPLVSVIQLHLGVVLFLSMIIAVGVKINAVRHRFMRTNKQEIDTLTIFFDKQESVIFINDKQIPISFASNQYYLCEAVFSKKNKRWEVDELLEKFGEEIESNGWRKIYDATNQINKKTKAYLPEKLILAEGKTYRFNTSLLK